MNNFDQSSAGVNLELTIHYSTDQASFLFDDNFIRNDQLSGYSLLNDHYSRVDVFQFIDFCIM